MNFRQQKLEAEINILSLRAKNDEERIRQIDEEIYTFFESKNPNEEVCENLKQEWQKNANTDETNVKTAWKKKIAEQKALFEKDKNKPPAESEESAKPKQPYHPPNSYQRSSNPAQSQRRENAMPNNHWSQNQKNYHSQPYQPPPPRFHQPNFSTFRPSPWHKDTSHY